MLRLPLDAIYANEFLKAAREEVRYNDLKDGKLKVGESKSLGVSELERNERNSFESTCN